MDISSDKLLRLHKKRQGRGYERDISKTLLIAAQNNAIMLKRKFILHNEISSVVYAEKEMKQLIT